MVIMLFSLPDLRFLAKILCGKRRGNRENKSGPKDQRSPGRVIETKLVKKNQNDVENLKLKPLPEGFKKRAVSGEIPET
jgi:hypothetical protein